MRKKRKKEERVLEERSKKLKVKLALFFSLFKICLFSISANKSLCICITLLHFPNIFSTANKDKSKTLPEKVHDEGLHHN